MSQKRAEGYSVPYDKVCMDGDPTQDPWTTDWQVLGGEAARSEAYILTPEAPPEADRLFEE